MTKKPLALLHCALGRAANWRPFIDAFGPEISPLNIELPSHGLADEWDRSRTYADHALEIALEEMPSEPVPLIGHSYGAALALRLAVERPYRVSSLVLIEPVFFAAARGTEVYDLLMRDLKPFENSMSSGAYATAVKQFHAIWGQGDWSSLSPDQRSYMTDRIGLIAETKDLTNTDGFDLLDEGRIEGLDMPVTFIDGSRSHEIISAIISVLGDRVPKAEWTTIEGAGHMVPISHPKLVVEAIRDRVIWP